MTQSPSDRAASSVPDEITLQDLQDDFADTPDMPDAPAPIGAMAMKPDAGTVFRQKKAAAARRGRIGVIALIWGSTLALLIAAAAIAYFNRFSLVERAPGLASVYGALGIKTTEGGLTLDVPVLESVRVDTVPTLLLSGTVRNPTGRVRTVPLVRMQLQNASGEALAEWSVDVSPARIDARSTRDFSAEYPNPPVDASQLVYGFE